MKSVVVRKTKRLSSGHLWVFSNELAEKPTGFEPGELVELISTQGEFLAMAYINPHSLIAARILCRQRIAIDTDFLNQRIADAIAFRKRLYGNVDSGRLVFAESDGLPGLVIDRYTDTVVIQSTTAGIDRLLDPIVDAVNGLLSPRCIVLRNDTAIRRLEGITESKQVLKGKLQPLAIINEAGVQFEIDCWEGQKTGFFMDQKENRVAFADLVSGGEGLDLCSNVGAWAIHMAKRGVKVKCIDIAQRAIEQVNRQAKLNGLEDQVQAECGNVFDYLGQTAAKSYDAIVLDPPAFAKSKAKIRNALKAYQTINGAAMSALKTGGLLATSSCSYHINLPDFIQILQQAAKISGVKTRIIEIRSQAKDHPSLLAMPETRYLKCVFLQRI
ncbi:MAG TPA: class I SAM-dependent rRNA methyltransferase [Acidiferrobacteraceae bacterium]|nr:class I SAM-dependent rRNA methyltransferase [Acidiferrobacteraceae bacterium]